MRATKLAALALLLAACCPPQREPSEFNAQALSYIKQPIELHLLLLAGRAPSWDAMDNLKEKARLHAGGIASVTKHYSNDANVRWNTANLLALQRDHVRVAHETMVVAYVAGSYNEEQQTYGIKLSPTFVAVFPDRAKDLEPSVLLHEFGHLLGLNHHDWCVMSEPQVPLLDFCDKCKGELRGAR
jgi:hypothetical protein